MKSYEEIARNVFRRRDEYLEKRKQRFAVIRKTSAAAACLCLTTVLGTMFLHNADSQQDVSKAEKDSILFSNVTSEISPKTLSVTDAKYTHTQSSSSAASSSVSSMNTSYTTTTVTLPTTATAETQMPHITIENIPPAVTNTTAPESTVTAVSFNSTAAITTVTSTVSFSASAASTAAVSSTTTTTTAAFSSSAAESTTEIQLPDEGFIYALRASESRADTIYIDPEELENGDYRFNASLYILTQAMQPSDIKCINAAWNGYLEDGRETKYIRFENCSNFVSAPSEYELMQIKKLQENGILIDELEVEYKPTCLSIIYAKQNISRLRTMWYAEENYWGPITISKTVNQQKKYYIVYSAGVNQIYIINDSNEKEYYTLTVDDITGKAVCEEINLVIRGYNPDTPANELLIKENNRIYASKRQDVDSEWFGGRSDVFPFVSFDIVIDKDTPNGTYYAALANDYLNGIGYTYNGVSYESDASGLNDPENWLKIVVGDTEK